MTIRFRPYIKYIVGLAVIFILMFLLDKGCSISRQAILLSKELQTKNDSLTAKITIDSTTAIENKKEYETALDLANGQVEIKGNQIAKTETELDAANKRINTLIANHKDILPDSDTSSTYVPNEFITDCNGCFTELSNGQKLVQQYKSDNEQLKLSLHLKEKFQTDRIVQQDQEKIKLAKSLQDCMDISKAAQKALSPHGQLYFSWNVIWTPFPIAAGIGGIYQNKRKMQYGVKWLYGRYGQMIETEINLPLSLKRK